mgnify:CR=1 FL=1
MTRQVLLVALLTVSAAACAKSGPQQQAEDAGKKTAAGALEAGRPPAQVAQDSSRQTSVAGKAVDFETLKSVLPELAGWARGDTKGEQMTMPVSYSRAQARYEKDAAHIELEITDTALNQLLLAPLSMFIATGYSERSDEGFKRAARIAGQPGMEEWNLDSRHGEVTAVVAARFIVHATGHDVEAIDSVRAAVQAVDLARLATLK